MCPSGVTYLSVGPSGVTCLSGNVSGGVTYLSVVRIRIMCWGDISIWVTYLSVGPESG